MKPFYLFTILLSCWLTSLQSVADSSSSLRIIGRAPASVDIDFDTQGQMLKARANFPFLMSYRTAEAEESNYVVRVASEATLKVPGSREPVILEIISP